MFKDINRAFAIEYDCPITYSSKSYVVYHIKHNNHSHSCRMYHYDT